MSSKPSLAALLSKTSLDDHEELLQASEVALKAPSSDQQAQIVKVVALLNLARYHDAITFLEASGPSLKDRAALEYAYALYKDAKLQEAAVAASRIKDSRGALHVEAQARYRLGEAEKTAQIYRNLAAQQISSEEFDLRVNQGAIDALAEWSGVSGSVRKPGREDLEAFETAYNAACGSIAIGELAQAEILLRRAKELCKHSEDLTEEQKEEELAPIIVQQVYVLLRQGKEAEAETVANEIDIGKIEDRSTKKVAANNALLTSKQPLNPFLAYKSMHETLSIPQNDKLFSYQAMPMLSNEKTIDLQSFKLGSLKQSSKKARNQLPSASMEPEALMLSVCSAAAHARNEVGKAAINHVLPELERRPNDIGLILTLVQMYILTGNSTSAIELVEGLFKRLENSTAPKSEQEVRYHPGLVSVLIGLYRRQGRSSHIKQELAKAASYWRHKSKPPVTLLRAAGILLLKSSTQSDLSLASDLFTKLYEQQPNDKATVAGYVASHALLDPKSIESLVDKLTPVSKLIANVDIDALESAGIPQSSNTLAIAASTSRTSRKRAAGATEGEPARKRRVRKSRLPKDFDPASTTKLDPERWLPMRDRSYYRAPKSKKKGRKGDDRTQGGNVNEDLDVSKQSQIKGGDVVVGGSGGGGGKKKKGKGKK